MAAERLARKAPHMKLIVKYEMLRIAMCEKARAFDRSDRRDMGVVSNCPGNGLNYHINIAESVSAMITKPLKVKSAQS
ncbi:hypothetical protein [Asticcacaulis excentricus]|uniref:hypothetical protein n=1 Tax=Asticcacaulis excentricus TaxID=78587 RepID=UPI001561E628|nr:hypothetical protein [Asticcacaulis excentricus]